MIQEMRRTYKCHLLLAVTLLSFATALFAKTPKWKSYSYPSDGFCVFFPSDPKVERSSVPIDTITVELRTYTATSSSATLYVGVADFGAIALGLDPDALLQAGKNGGLSNSKSHLLSEKNIFLGKYHGLEFEAEDDKFYTTARIYLVGGILYQTMVASPIRTKYADTARFLDSFQLIPRVDSEAPATQTTEWKTYSYPSDGFSASFPAEPQLSKNNVETKTGKFEVHTYSVILKPAWVVAVVDYGQQAKNADPDTLLGLGKQGALSNSNAHLVSEKKITLDGNHGLEFEVESDMAHYSYRIYLVGGTLYQTLVISDTADKYVDAARFLDSFRLIARVDN
jgi:hypothetical protein